MAESLSPPFPPVPSDAGLRLARAPCLPGFEAGGMVPLERPTSVPHDGAVGHVFHPIFPTDPSAAEAAAWLRPHPVGRP